MTCLCVQSVGRPSGAGCAAWPNSTNTHPNTTNPDKPPPKRRNRAAVPFIVLTPWDARDAKDLRAVRKETPLSKNRPSFSGATIRITEVDLRFFQTRMARNSNEKWTHAFHWWAGLALILLFNQGATQTGFS